MGEACEAGEMFEGAPSISVGVSIATDAGGLGCVFRRQLGLVQEDPEEHKWWLDDVGRPHDKDVEQDSVDYR